MPSTFQDRRRIEFYETDMAGIVHFSNYFRFMEASEHAFFRSLGFTLHREEEGKMSGWARVRASCEYRLPLHYMDEIEVELAVRARKKSSLAYDFVFRRVADRNGPTPHDEVALGHLEVVHIERLPGGRIKATPMPDEIARAIDVAGES